MKLLPTNPLFQQDHFGLAISQNALRAISVSSGSKLVKSMAEVPIPATIIDHRITDKQVLVDALKKIQLDGKFSSRYVSVILPDDHSFSRLYQLPKINFDEVTEAISWQIEKIFPLPKNDIYFDWKLIRQNEDGTLTVLVVALGKTLLDDLVEVFEQAGIRAISFEPAASSITRIISNTDESTILIQINQTGSSVTLVENQLSTLTVTNRFETGLDTNQAFQKTKQSVQELLLFRQSHYKNTTNSQTLPVAFLTGESATQELAAWLTNFLKIDVKLLEIPGISPAYHEAFAAASESIFSPQSHLSINLLPEVLQNIYNQSLKYKQMSTIFQSSLVMLLLAVGLVGTTFATLFFMVSTSQAQLLVSDSNTNNQIYDTKKVAVLNQTSSTILELFPVKTTPVDYFKDIYETTPKSVSLTKVDYVKDKNQIVLIGRSETRGELLRYKSLLENLDIFSDIVVPIQSLVTSEKVDFSITLILKK